MVSLILVSSIFTFDQHFYTKVVLTSIVNLVFNNMPFKKYPAVLRAEDNFRLALFPQQRDCLWNVEAEDKIPRQWTDNSTKNKYKAERKLYNDHLEVLNNAFVNEESPFELKRSVIEGIGIYCKRDITMSDYNNTFKNLLIGFTMRPVDESVRFSLVEMKVKKRTLGRPPKDGCNHKSEVYSLYGPISFANHACQSKHATFNLRKKKDSEDFCLTIKKNLKKGDQVTISYGDTFRSVSCNYCKRARK